MSGVAPKGRTSTRMGEQNFEGAGRRKEVQAFLAMDAPGPSFSQRLDKRRAEGRVDGAERSCGRRNKCASGQDILCSVSYVSGVDEILSWPTKWIPSRRDGTRRDAGTSLPTCIRGAIANASPAVPGEIIMRMLLPQTSPPQFMIE